MFSPSGFPSRMRATDTPATIALVLVLAASFLLSWLGLRSFFGLMLGLPIPNIGSQVWGLFTYGIASAGNGRMLLFLLFTLFWLYTVGSSLERAFGSRWLVIAWVTSTALCGLFLALGGALVSIQALETGPSLPIAALTMIWCARTPAASVLLMGMLPMLLKWLAILTVALVLFGYGTAHPIYGVFAALPLGLAWMVGQGRVPFLSTAGQGGNSAKRERGKSESQWQSFKADIETRRRERDERERLRKIFEASLIDDPEERK